MQILKKNWSHFVFCVTDRCSCFWFFFFYQATVKYPYVGRSFTYIIVWGLSIEYKKLLYTICQVGTLAIMAHLLNDNTGDLISVHCELKSHVEFKGKRWFDFDIQYESEHWKVWRSNPLHFGIIKLEVSEICCCLRRNI